ncbi:Tetratricopeptide repeat protein 29 [Liparis tanakae]|uniref:Tetratricopeptide repeat protein 29 n=1 Tax=Liparis tanakae TaxID=230148 RepID=A0A4Z2JJX0_9TELE|nr:Tetratricopeptide repeat protein 29 [Liparis tanakae]
MGDARTAQPTAIPPLPSGVVRGGRANDRGPLALCSNGPVVNTPHPRMDWQLRISRRPHALQEHPREVDNKDILRVLLDSALQARGPPGEAAGPGSAIWWQKPLEEQPGKLDQLHHFLTAARVAPPSRQLLRRGKAAEEIGRSWLARPNRSLDLQPAAWTPSGDDVFSDPKSSVKSAVREHAGAALYCPPIAAVTFYDLPCVIWAACNYPAIKAKLRRQSAYQGLKGHACLRQYPAHISGPGASRRVSANDL